MVNRNRGRTRLKMTAGGTGVANHCGTRLLSDLADTVGLTAALSTAMAPTKQRRRGHDRGQVLADVAVMLADGGETISDLAVLRDQPDLFGDVASHPTVWRTLAAVDADALARIRRARAETRRTVWAAGADPGFYVIDIDATLINAHSEKEHAAPTYKRGFGFHPLLAYLDATGEALAGLLRRGNAGSGTASDHVTVLDDALFQLPLDPHESEIIVRSDSAGWSHDFVDHCRTSNVQFVIGHALTVDIAQVLVKVPKRKWQPAISPDGSELRDHGEIVEITDLVNLDGWPDGCRMIARREIAHPGAQLTFTDIDGHRFQVFVTDHTDPDIGFLEALYRGRGRAERQICDTKATGLSNLPSHSFDINQTWVECCLIAHDLLAWTRHLLLDRDDINGLVTAEPKRLRYCLFHTAGNIATTARQRFCRLADTWPWTDQLIEAFERLHHIPLRI